MFIMCQKCHTFYQVPKDLIVAKAMTFKCKKCGFTWTTHIDDALEQPPVTLSETEENNLPDDTDEIFGPAVVEKNAEPTFQKNNVFSPVEEEKTTSFRLLPWIVLVLLALNLALFFYQKEVSQWLSKEILSPVVVQNVSFSVLHEGLKPKLRVYAQLVNTRAQTIPVSPVVLTLFDEEDNQIQREEVRLSNDMFEPHQVIPMDYVLDPINTRARRIEIKVKDAI